MSRNFNGLNHFKALLVDINLISIYQAEHPMSGSSIPTTQTYFHEGFFGWMSVWIFHVSMSHNFDSNFPQLISCFASILTQYNRFLIISYPELTEYLLVLSNWGLCGLLPLDPNTHRARIHFCVQVLWNFVWQEKFEILSATVSPNNHLLNPRIARQESAWKGPEEGRIFVSDKNIAVDHLSVWYWAASAFGGCWWDWSTGGRLLFHVSWVNGYS